MHKKAKVLLLSSSKSLNGGIIQETIDRLKVEFAELTTQPEEVIRNLIEFLGIEPTAEEIQSAIDHVNPDLRKFG